MILSEIIPAFQGIAKKLVPNSKPALDVPIVFPYAPNAVLIGFFVSFIVGVISMLIMLGLGTTVIIPGVVGIFFCGGVAGSLWQCFWRFAWGDYRLNSEWITVSLGSTFNSACLRFVWSEFCIDLCRFRLYCFRRIAWGNWQSWINSINFLYNNFSLNCINDEFDFE